MMSPGAALTEPSLTGLRWIGSGMQNAQFVSVSWSQFPGYACWTCEPRSYGVKTQGGHAIAAPHHKPERVSHVQTTWNFHLCP